MREHKKPHKFGRRTLLPEEAELWNRVVKSIKSPSKKNNNLAPETYFAEALRAMASVDSVPAVALSTIQNIGPQTPSSPLVPLERRQRLKVVRGKIDFDSAIDLHGMDQHQAHTALCRFMQISQAQGRRLVLVITGKGRAFHNVSSSPIFAETGVLKRSVPVWLRAPELRNVILGFEEAAPHHGGEGALYVRLRKLGQPDRGSEARR